MPRKQPNEKLQLNLVVRRQNMRFTGIFVISCAMVSCASEPSAVPCDIDRADKLEVLSNLFQQMKKEMPDHYAYCEFEDPPENFVFSKDPEGCRVYVGCSKQLDGNSLLHGDWFVTFDPVSKAIVNFYDVKW